MRRRGAGAALSLLVVLSVLAAALTARTLLAGPAAPPGAAVDSAWGQLRVTALEVSRGLTAQQLANSGHGIQGLVGEDDQLVRVHVLLTGDAAPAPASGEVPPSLMTVEGEAAVAALGGTLPAGAPGGESSLEASLSYVVPKGEHPEYLLVPVAGGTARLPLTGVPVSVDGEPAGAPVDDLPVPSAPSPHRH